MRSIVVCIKDIAERLTWDDLRIIGACAGFVWGGLALVRLLAWALVALGLI